MGVIGTTLAGRYLLTEELGTGGMGIVYRATDMRTGADVAVKMAHSFLARDPSYAQRLQREARIAATLQSPRIARVTDYDEHEGTPFLVMEYAPGETLARIISRQGPIFTRRALEITLDVARALDVAHGRNVVHRDLKPHNICVDGSDVRVLDFGIARTMGEPGITSNSILLGSPEYLAPERTEGGGDIRSDIYSLGVVLYEMLTGRVPFGGVTPWQVVRNAAADPLPALPAGFPTPVQRIVERCLAKLPQDRFQTPAELIAALQSALAMWDQPVTAELSAVAGGTGPYARPTGTAPAPAGVPPRQPDTVAAPSRRSRLPLLLGAGGALLAALAVVLLMRRGSGVDSGASLVDNPPVPATVAASPGSGASPTVAATASASGPVPSVTVASASGSNATVQITAPAEGAQTTSPVLVQVQVSGATLRPPTDGDATARHLHYFVDTNPAAVLSPGVPVPTGSQSIIHTPMTMQVLPLPPGPHNVWVVITDNNHVPFAGDQPLKVSFTVTGTGARTGEASPVVYQSLQDGKWRLVTMSGTGRDGRVLSASQADDIEPSWSPDGSRVVFSSNRDGRFHLYAINADGGGLQQLTRGDSQDRAPVWSPDGQQIAFSSNRAGPRDEIFVVPVAGGEPRRITTGGGSQPTWSPDSTRVAFVREQGDVSHIWVTDVVGGQPRQLTTAAQRHIDPAWSPDGAQIAFAAFRNNSWNVFLMSADGSDVRQLTNEDVNRNPAWSPDGRQIVFASGREGQQQVFALPLSSGQARRLTEGLAHNLHPTWPRR